MKQRPRASPICAGSRNPALMRTFKLIRSLPASAAYNMALDEKIFTRYLEDGVPVLRVYRWQSPSFTYGVSQSPESEIDMPRCVSDGVGVAKRMTGGGILFHHDELTYSFVCGKEDVGEPKNIFVAYREICAFLIRFYESFGFKATFALESEGFKDKCAPSALCSASYEKYDILINGKKIGGNAQKRRRQVIFQHGSIPFRIDWEFVRRYVKSLPADIGSHVTDLSRELKVVPDKDTAEQKLIDAFKDSFGVNFIEEQEALHETTVVK